MFTIKGEPLTCFDEHLSNLFLYAYLIFNVRRGIEMIINTRLENKYWRLGRTE
jgi:hypothetical protein